LQFEYTLAVKLTFLVHKTINTNSHYSKAMESENPKKSKLEIELELAKKHLAKAKANGLEFSISCFAMKRAYNLKLTDIEEESLELYDKIKGLDPADLSTENVLKYSQAIRRFDYYQSPMVDPDKDTESKELNCTLNRRSPFCGEDYV